MRKIEQIVDGEPASDGGGVSLLRVIGNSILDSLDPFLLLDEFKNDNPASYAEGFPNHPHRGFETVTYMKRGKMRHRDSRGNEGLVSDGGVQQMTAGRGVVHSEMPEQTDGLLWGYQLWINLPAAKKMIEPRYQDLDANAIPIVTDKKCKVKIIAGNWNGCNGVCNTVWPVDLLDVELVKGAEFRHCVPDGYNLALFVYEGRFLANGQSVSMGQIGIFSREGDLYLEAGEDGTSFLILAGKPIDEPVARMGPFVMNNRTELIQAVEDYRQGLLS